jgi:hypothetical protein
MWSQDQLIPIHRNGRIEDVYWTFGYSPVLGDSGDISGVLIICNETTVEVIWKPSVQRLKVYTKRPDTKDHNHGYACLRSGC